MKKTSIFYILLLLIASLNAGAQVKKMGKNFSRVKTLKVNFISEELDLSPETASKFWPLFNAFEKKTWLLRHREVYYIKKEINKAKKENTLNAEKAKFLLNKLLKLDERVLSTKKKYYKNLEAILSPNQLAKMYFTEENFNRKVLQRLHQPAAAYRNKSQISPK